MNPRRQTRHLAIITTVLFCSIFSVQSWGWGQRGHETIEEVAMRLLPKSELKTLLENNLANVKFLSMVPDLHWKHGSDKPHPLEGETHFFTVDYYSPRGQAIPKDIDQLVAKFGMETVIKEGTAPWRMHQMAVLLAHVLKKPHVSRTEVLQVAATLGHYVGDLGNPLHVSRDFDGADIGRHGLHAYFESVTVNNMDVRQLLSAVGQTAAVDLPKIPNDVHPIDGAFALAAQGHNEARTLLADAKSLGLTPALQRSSHPIIVRTMAASAAMLAKVWYEAYVLAGSPNLDTRPLERAGVPPYVEVTYLKGAEKMFELGMPLNFSEAFPQ